jgi:hypothetical protein
VRLRERPQRSCGSLDTADVTAGCPPDLRCHDFLATWAPSPRPLPKAGFSLQAGSEESRRA